MDKVLELELRQSEARQELAGHPGDRTPTTEKVGVLNIEMRSLDRQLAWATRSLIPNLRLELPRGARRAVS